MQITWLGNGCVRLQGGDLVALIDPPGLRAVRQEPRLLILPKAVGAHGHASLAKEYAGEKTFVIERPGEYEVSGVFVEGFLAPDAAQTLYRLEWEGMHLAHLGPLAKNGLTDLQLQTLEDVDILFLPVGNKETMSASAAAELVSELEPRVVIPIYFAPSGVKSEFDSVDKFLKEMGRKVEPVEKWKAVAKDLPQEETQVVVLSAS